MDTDSQFRPHRATIILRHVQSVFHPSLSTSEISHTLPLTQLDVPQRILISFSKAILWAWTQWNDSRIAGIESILIWVCDSRPLRSEMFDGVQTATWIHHLPSIDSSEWDSETRDALDKRRVQFSIILTVNFCPSVVSHQSGQPLDAIEAIPRAHQLEHDARRRHYGAVQKTCDARKLTPQTLYRVTCPMPRGDDKVPRGGISIPR